MTREERTAVENNLIFRHPPSDHEESTRESQQALCKEYLDYRTEIISMMESPDDMTYQMIKENEISAMQLWQSSGRDWPTLQGLAKKCLVWSQQQLHLNATSPRLDLSIPSYETS